MTRNCHNHKPQTNSWHCEEEAEIREGHNTIRVKQPAFSSSGFQFLIHSLTLYSIRYFKIVPLFYIFRHIEKIQEKFKVSFEYF